MQGALPPGSLAELLYRGGGERERETLHFQSPVLSVSQSPRKTNPPHSRSPQRSLYGERCPFPEPSFTHLSEPPKAKSPGKKKTHLSFKIPVKEPPLHVPPNGAAMERDAPFPEPVVYSFIHMSQESLVKELSHEIGGKHMVTVHGTPPGRKAYLQWGADWFPKGIVFDTAVTTPVSCSL